jgi:hypothetical protein
MMVPVLFRNITVAFIRHADYSASPPRNVPGKHWRVSPMSYVLFRNSAGRVVLSGLVGDASGLLAVEPICVFYESRQVGRRIGGRAYITVREAVPTETVPLYGPLPADPGYDDGNGRRVWL